MNQEYDVIIAGAGPVGCLMAERFATDLNWKVLLIDKRNHVAGNCFDTYHESGLMIHRYGPHYFRSNNKSLIEYLTRFTDWIPGNYIVKSSTNGELFPFPINLLTLGQFFKIADLDAESAQKLLEEKREKIDQPANSEEFVLSRVGKEMYEAFYLGYTLKQWSIHPRDLAPSVCGRIPVRLNKDERYVDHEYQLTPAKGFTAMFQKMVDHPNIDLQLETDYAEVKNKIKATKATIYTGPIDEYFDAILGKLPWRSLEFDFVKKDVAFEQPCVQINYPNDHDYTRTVEIKHVTGQLHPQTVISYEYPKAEGDPYYPIPMEKNQQLYLQYKKLADQETADHNVFFCGRLAEYKYYNTDEVLELALKTFEKIKTQHGH
jgi:UDP-galactopyranose mutase